MTEKKREVHQLPLEATDCALILSKEKDGDSYGLELVTPTHSDEDPMLPYEIVAIATALFLQERENVDLIMENFERKRQEAEGDNNG